MTPSLVLLILLIRSTRALACVPPYYSLRGVCVSNSTVEVTFCEAQAFCHQITGELLTGSTFFSLFASSPVYDDRGKVIKYWVGMHDFVRERNTSSSGWQWTNGDIFPKSDAMVWMPNQPQGDTEGLDRDCSAMKNRVSDSWCFYKRAVVCQPRAVRNSLHFRENVVSSGLPDSSLATGACNRSYTHVDSVIECGAACMSDPGGWCGSFYFHNATRSCFAILYTDALLKLSTEDGWRKFSAISN